MVWNWLKNVGKGVTGSAKVGSDTQMYLAADKQAESTALSLPGNTALAEQREEMQVAQLKLQYLQQTENQQGQGWLAETGEDLAKELPEKISALQPWQGGPNYEGAKELQEKYHAFQGELAKLNHERAKELQEFIQRVQIALSEKNLDFQRWRWEEEKSLQLQVLELNHELQRSLADYQKETSLKLVEEQKRLENSPIWLVASDLLNSHSQEEVMPLRIFFAPPKIQFERPDKAGGAGKEFPEIELTLGEGLRQFLREYSAQGRSLDFLAGAWVSKTFHSEASIKALFSALKSEPTLVLESEVDGNYLNFRVAYWSLNWPKYRYDPVISRLPYRDILYEAAKARARKWPETRAKLVAAGEAPEDVDRLYGGENLKNWQILQREERFREAGIDSSEVEFNYIVTRKDFEELCQFLIICHCLFAGLVADEYFLFEYNQPPVLPQLIPALTANVPDREAVRDIMEAVVLYNYHIYEALEAQRPALVPDLALDWARSLSHLPQKTWAKGRVVYSVQCWLKQNGLSQPQEFEELLDTLESALKVSDVPYVEKLNECLVALGESRRLSVIDACYNRGVSRCKLGEYKSAIADFDQAIQLNPKWAEAYYNRGRAYEQLEEYEQAIEDYTLALRTNQNSAVAYCQRGNAYYKMGQYEPAIADYDRALAVNPNLTEAISNRNLARGVWEEIKRKEEDQRKRRLEAAAVAYTLTGHSSTVCAIAISPDGQTLVSGSWDNSIKIWKLSTREAIRTLMGDSKWVLSLAISPDGKTLVSGSADSVIKIWELSTGQEIRALKGHSSWVRSLAISPDGQLLVSGSEDNTIKIWKLNTGEEIHTLKGHSSWVRSLAICPDGQTLVSGSDDSTIKLWNLSTGKEIRTLKGHSSWVLALGISPDGQTLVSGSDDSTIKMWNLSTGQEIRTLTGHAGSVFSLAISPEGQTLVTGGGDSNVKIWQLSTGQEIRTLTGHSNWVLSLAITPDGHSLISGSSDSTIKIWQLA
ncbi:WD40 domain-containing protein [Kamptonema formosum]|uniref:WD40 domain-containing protein n=1 Tax=Kamptonema formosum TaxID=331992 RepID=UPI00034AF2F2|nr:tetratricopeptide repeat protein [Oscillatoria sp. PCC 10802]